MNKRILIYLVATSAWFLFTASTCEEFMPDMEEPARFVVWNNTSDTLVWIECAYIETLPETFNLYRSHKISPNNYGIKWYSNGRDDKVDDLLRYYFSLLPYGYSTEIFISLDTIKKYGWDDVVKNNRIYQRYDLCYDDVAPIQASTVGYIYNHDCELWFSVPPTDCMKDVKMWPPYGHYGIIGQ